MAFLGKRYFAGEAVHIPKEWSVYDGVNEFVWWPKCFVCTAKDARGRMVPVESYGLNDDRPTSRTCRKTLLIGCECHGKRQTAKIEVPHWWSEGMERYAVSQLRMFGPELPDDGQVKWIGKG